MGSVDSVVVLQGGDTPMLLLLNLFFHIIMTMGAIIAVIAAVGLWSFCLYAIFIESVPLFHDEKQSPIRIIINKIEEHRNARS